MRYNPKTLEQAKVIASRLKHEEITDGGQGVDFCPTCNEELFVVEKRSSDGVVAAGYCMTPDCGFKRSWDEAEDEAMTARIAEED